MHLFLILIAILTPAKTWLAPDQPWTVTVKPQGEISLLLTDFAGRPVSPKTSADISAEKSVNLKEMFPAILNTGTYVLFEIPKGSTDTAKFVGTPLVIEVKQDKQRGAPEGPMVVKMLPLQYALMQTDQGPITMAFYYDAAPHTVDNFLTLSSDGYYDGLTFHRIIPGFVLQAGDPRGDGSGGPGYNITAEFNDRPHTEGVLSMARKGDPNESSGGMPRSEFANSAGSQFFVCLDYAHTKNLDQRYTAFGVVTDGMNAVKQIAKVPLADERAGRPEKPVYIRKVQVLPVTNDKNPYHEIIRATLPTTFPTTIP